MVSKNRTACAAADPQREAGVRRMIAEASESLETGKYLEAEAKLSEFLSGLAESIPVPLPEKSSLTQSLAGEAVLLSAEAVLRHGDPEGAVRRITEGEKNGWLRPENSRSSMLRANALLGMGRAREAREILNRELRSVSECGEIRLYAKLLQVSGAAEEFTGHPQSAQRRLRDSVALFRAIGDKRGLAVSSLAFAGFNRRVGRLREAEAGVADAAAAVSCISAPREKTSISFEKILILQAAGRFGETFEILADLAQREDRDPESRLSVVREVAEAKSLIGCGRLDEAEKTLSRLLLDVDGVGAKREKAEIRIGLGDVYAKQEKPDEAKVFYLKAEALGEEIFLGAEIKVGLALRFGKLFLAEGEPRRAGPMLRKAASVAARHGWKQQQGMALAALGESHRIRGRLEQACVDFSAAASCFDSAGDHARQGAALLEAASTWHRRHQDKERMLQTAGFADTLSGADSGADQVDELPEAWCNQFMARRHYRMIDDGAGDAACDDLAAVLRMSESRNFCVTRSESSDRCCEKTGKGPRIVSVSPAMTKALDIVDMVAGTREPVLIFGETGTGKELVARRIHEMSDRCRGAFVAVNCSAVPDTMFEREFFGHCRGAFTGAEQSSPGFCQRAHGGTLFLDEIGDMSPTQQVKLLRLLQEGTFQALGDPTERRVELRTIAATNADLGSRMADGRFRRDLYYRLQILSVELPPLRERREDLEPLMREFIRRVLQVDVAPCDLFTDEALRAMTHYPWPGNIRELDGMTRRMALLAGKYGRATLAMLPPHIASWCDKPSAIRGGLDLSRHLDTAERGRIEHALVLSDGNRSRASKLLGISRNTLYKKMDRHGLA